MSALFLSKNLVYHLLMHESYKDKVIILSSYLAMLGCLFLFFIRLNSGESDILSISHFLVVPILLSISNYFINSRNDRRFFNYFFLVYICTFHIYKVIESGGILAHQIQWYYLFSFVLTILFSFKYSLFYYAYNLVILTLYFVYSGQYLIDINYQYASTFIVISTILLGFFYYFELLYDSSKLQSLNYENAKKLDEIKSNLLHEINNPLSVVLNISEISFKKNPDDLNSKLVNNSKRISLVMDKLKRLDNLNDLNKPSN